MNPNEYFNQLLTIDPFYESEAQFFEPFWNFMYRFQSLQRHWELNKSYISNHISILKNAQSDGSGEFDLAFSETAEIDFEFFPEYLRLSTISFSISLVENLLGSLSEEIAKDLGIKIELDKRPMPYINKYIMWFIRGCGIDIHIEKTMWKNLDAIREIRNRFIHRIDRDLPDQIRNTIGEMVSSIDDEGDIISDDFVDASLSKLAELVKTIELNYIEFYEKNV